MSVIQSTKKNRKLRLYERHNNAAGRKRTPTYMAWQNMIMRCANPNRPDYAWARLIGISRESLRTRLIRGWTLEEALTLPGRAAR